MTITDGLITLAEARASLGWAATDTSKDSDLEKYIEAATPVIENITGPLLVKSRVFTFDGGVDQLVIPVRFTSVTSIVEDGVTITDYVAEPRNGIVTAGETTGSRYFSSGIQNIVVTVSVGSGTVPANVKLGTRELVRFWWQQGQQANTPAFGGAPESMPLPMGFAVPRRVMELLEPSPRVAGFA